jgi:serine/threonine protein phosphatase 1
MVIKAEETLFLRQINPACRPAYRPEQGFRRTGFVLLVVRVHILPDMIANLFGRRQPDPPEARVPAGTRAYAIGDIHGCIEPLRALLDRVRDDAAAHAAPRNVVIYLGDYVDRGTHSRGVIDLILSEPLAGFERVYLKGNHEESLIRFLADERSGAQWFAYGGDATLYSYGVRPPPLNADKNEFQRAQREFAQKLPAAHLAFFERLSLMHIEGDYAFVHAGIRPRVPIDRQASQDLLWIRDEFLQSNLDFGKVVVHGHSISEAPAVRPNRIGIDTGAFASGHLTCLILEDTRRSFLAT